MLSTKKNSFCCCCAPSFLLVSFAFVLLQPLHMFLLCCDPLRCPVPSLLSPFVTAALAFMGCLQLHSHPLPFIAVLTFVGYCSFVHLSPHLAVLTMAWHGACHVSPLWLVQFDAQQ